MCTMYFIFYLTGSMSQRDGIFVVGKVCIMYLLFGRVCELVFWGTGEVCTMFV